MKPENTKMIEIVLVQPLGLCDPRDPIRTNANNAKPNPAINAPITAVNRRILVDPNRIASEPCLIRSKKL